MPAFHLGLALGGGDMGMLHDHLARQKEDFMGEIAGLLEIDPEDAAHAGVDEVAQAEVGGPHVGAQEFGQGIAVGGH